MCPAYLVQPAETIGTVGQLSADLLIETLQLRLAGYLESKYVQPCAGLGAYHGGGDTLHLALELYVDSRRSLMILQQRAPVLRGCQAQFAGDLADWLQHSSFKEVTCSFPTFDGTNEDMCRWPTKLQMCFLPHHRSYYWAALMLDCGRTHRWQAQSCAL